jgi:hypothetical protein
MSITHPIVWRDGPFRINSEGRCLVQGHGRYYAWARIVVENNLGRELSRGEVVHHINGDPSDDRIENLQVTDPQGHLDEHRASYYERMRKPRETRICPVCGTEFEVLASRPNRFCSTACGHKSRHVTHCKHGHPRTPETTHTYKNGRTYCLVCLRASSRRNRAKGKVTA